jgi:hypothetical protein
MHSTASIVSSFLGGRKLDKEAKKSADFLQETLLRPCNYQQITNKPRTTATLRIEDGRI